MGKVLLVTAFAAYGAVILATYLAYQQRTLDYRPDIDSLARAAGVGLPERDFTPVVGFESGTDFAYTGDRLHLWVALERAESLRDNQRVMSEKAAWARWAIRALFAEAVLLSLAALAAVF